MRKTKCREPPSRLGFRSALAPLRLLKQGVLLSHSKRDCPFKLKKLVGVSLDAKEQLFGIRTGADT